MKGTKLPVALLHFLRLSPVGASGLVAPGQTLQGPEPGSGFGGSRYPGACGQGRNVGAPGAAIKGGGGTGVGAGTLHCPSGTPPAPRHLSPWLAWLRAQTGLDAGIRRGLLAPAWWPA